MTNSTVYAILYHSKSHPFLHSRIIYFIDYCNPRSEIDIPHRRTKASELHGEILKRSKYNNKEEVDQTPSNTTSSSTGTDPIPTPLVGYCLVRPSPNVQRRVRLVLLCEQYKIRPWYVSVHREPDPLSIFFTQ